MKKKLIIVGVVILVIMIITVVVIEVKRVRFENVATIASEIVKENYDIDTKLEKYKRVKSKTVMNYIFLRLMILSYMEQ